MTKIAALKCIAAAGTVLICCALSTVPAAAACPDSKGEAASGCETFLIVELDGVNSRIQLFEVLGKLRSRFGDKAFPTRPYTVRPNDTLCSIYNEQAKLPVNAAACPRAAESLNRMLNGKSARLRPNAEIRIPDVKIETHRQYAVQQTAEKAGKSAIKETYVLRIPASESMAAEGVKYVLNSGMRNVTAYTSAAGAGMEKSLQTDWKSPDEAFCRDVATNGPNSGEASFFYLFDWLKRDNWPDDPTYEQIKQCALSCQATAGKPCADLVLLDTPVAPHSDIERIQSVDQSGEPIAPLPPAGNHSCTVAERFSEDQHGTHLASIIASKPDDRGFVGISPGLDVFAFPWTRETTFEHLLGFIRKRTDLIVDAESPEAGLISPVVTRGPQVFMFASRFPPPDRSDSIHSYSADFLNGSRLKAGRKPWRSSALSQAVVNSAATAVWVVAAMQKGGRIPESEEIVPESGFSPVNLGAASNVIVVSACERCSDGDAMMWKDAFWSGTMVHVAAPGMNVLAPVGPGKVARAGGTSQSTAIVAGVVGAMLNCHRDHYVEEGILKPGKIKQRLLYTSRPIFYEDDDLQRLATGVVDPRTALLNPAVSWMLSPDLAGYRTLPSPPASWCAEKITMSDAAGNPKSAFTQNVRRLVRTTMPSGEADEIRRWVIFSMGRDEPPDPELQSYKQVERWAPRELVSPAPDAPLLKLENGKILRPKDFEDLILNGPLPHEPCGSG